MTAYEICKVTTLICLHGNVAGVMMDDTTDEELVSKKNSVLVIWNWFEQHKKLFARWMATQQTFLTTSN